MADNEIEEEPQDEEKSEGEGEGNEAKPSFLKSKLFKIIAGVIVLLLLAGGGYYFFVATEEVAPEAEVDTEETTSKTDEEDILNEENDIDPIGNDESTAIEQEDDDPSPMASQLGFGQDEEPTANESNDIFDAKSSDNEELSAKVTPEASDNELSEVQQENLRMKQQLSELKEQMSQIQKAIQQQQNTNLSTQTKPLAEQYNFDYQQDYGDSPRVREPSRTPPPKPSWGDFDRLNK